MPESSGAAGSVDTSPAPGRPATTGALVSWALFDWANTPFATIIQTFIFAAYFTHHVAPDVTTGTTLWGNAVGGAGLLVAIVAPLLGAFADQRGNRKPWIGVLSLICIAATAMLWTVQPSADYLWPALALLGIGIVGFELAGLLYNAMLPELSPARQVGRWSGMGWGLGYFGGVAGLLLALLAFINTDGAWFELDRERQEHVRATFILVAVWYLVFSLPFFLLTPDRRRTSMSWRRTVNLGLRQLIDSARHIRQYRHLVRFFIARMIYIDGLATVFAFGGIYAAGTFGLDEQQILYFGIGLNISGGLGAALFAVIDDRIGGRNTVLFALGGLLITATSVLLATSTLMFWIAGLALGLFVGPAQAASRSYLARMAPAELRNEMFGLLTFSGKATAFLGPLLVGWLTFASGSQRIGMSVVLLFFILGFVLMLGVPSDKK